MGPGRGEADILPPSLWIFGKIRIEKEEGTYQI
jgi:hypothetical protein